MQAKTQRLVASTVLLSILGVAVALNLIAEEAWGLLVFMIPFVPGLPLAVSYLIERPAGANPRFNLAIMLIFAVVAAAAMYLLTPQVQPLLKMAFSPFLFPLTKALWHAWSWAVIPFFPVLFLTLALDVMLLFVVLVFGFILCVSAPSLGALLGWLGCVALDRFMRKDAAPPPQLA